MPLRRRLLSPSYYVRRRALREGVLGRSTAWRIVAVAVFGGSALRRALGRRTEVVSIERLAPGQGVVITRLRPGEGRRTG